jgi:hypothetical protein
VSFNLPITIKEVAGTGATNYPVDVVVPLPIGKYSTSDTFRLVDLNGSDIPAQFKILNRWADENRSIRHLLVHFQTSVQAFTGAGSGLTQVFLRDDGVASGVSPLIVWESADMIEVTTGPLKFSVSKRGFKLIDAAWMDINQNGVFEDNEQYIMPGTDSGGILRNFLGAVNRDSDNKDVQVTVEENGPRRVVIKAEALSRGSTSSDIRHGFAVRLYAYAGLSMVKLDYQLQNSSKDNMFSWPLYFEDLGLNLSLTLPKDRTSVRVGMGESGSVFQRSLSSGLYLAQDSHNSFSVKDAASQAVQAIGAVPDGFIDLNDGTRGVTAILRYFAETWPNGISADSRSSNPHTELSFQLFPAWSAQRHQGSISPTGLYWLNDMQHVIKEVMLHFYAGNPDNVRSTSLARTFRFHPVGTVPASWHREASASLQFGGLVPDVNPSGSDVRLPKYLPLLKSVIGFGDPKYQFGWDNFGDLEPGYRDRTCTTGGWPYSMGAFTLTGNPSDYYEAELSALAELNRRPQWLPGYSHDADWARLKLSDNPYCGGSWRAFLGHGVIPYSSPWLPDTNLTIGARDNAHAWFYHIEEAYYITGNPWILDWYKFIGEYRRTTLDQLDPWPDRSGRALGHGVNHAFQAYRVTSDLALLDSIGTHIEGKLRKVQDRFYGDQSGDPHGGYMTGYLASAVVNYLEDSKSRNPQKWAQAFNYLSGLMEWNYHWGNYAFIWDVRAKKAPASSSGTSMVLGDPVAWYYWHTGNEKYLDHLKRYINTGINGGSKPYGNLVKWSGSYEGRWTTHVLNAKKDDSTRPTPVLDLTASRSTGGVMLHWTTPQTSARFHIVWSDRPITAHSTIEQSTINWWAANPVGPTLTPRPGERQSLFIPAGSGPIFAAIFSFDSKWNLSEMSNVASVSH